MTYEEVAQKIDELSHDIYALSKDAEVFENCRIMTIAKEALRNFSWTLDAIYEALTEE